MAFQKINLSDWARREHWAHYSRNMRYTYAMTTDIDISRLKPELKVHNLKLYPALLYMLSTIVNRHEEFRFAFGSGGEPVCFDQMHPTYTVFHADDETFSNLWTEYAPRFFDFHEAYLRELLSGIHDSVDALHRLQPEHLWRRPIPVSNIHLWPLCRTRRSAAAAVERAVSPRRMRWLSCCPVIQRDAVSG